MGAAYNLEKDKGTYLILVLILMGIATGIIVKFNKQLFYSSKKDRTGLLLFKALLSWMILTIMIVIFHRSPMRELLLEIISIVWSKL